MTLEQVKQVLGKPYFEVENFILYQGDCLELMPQLPDDLFHLTVTSPPYNIGKEYEAVLPLETYLQWSSSWIHQVYRITKSNGAFWLNLGYLPIEHKAKAIPIPYLLWDKIPFYLMQEIVWHYAAGVSGRKFFSPRNEKFLWYVKNPDDYTFNLDAVRDPDVKYPNQKKNGKIKVNPLGKNPGDVWRFAKVTSGSKRSSKERTSHPAQYPVGVITRIVKASSNEGDLLLDPFIGSGTTAVVGLTLNRPVVGFELKSEYCDVAAERIETYLQRLSLPKQRVLFE